MDLFGYSFTPVRWLLRFRRGDVLLRRTCGRPLVPAVSSFGFGGTNAHLIIEECLIEAPIAEEASYPSLISLSAKTPDALKQRIKDLENYLQQQETQPALSNLIYTLNCGREHFNFRCIFLVSSIEELKNTLTQIHENKKPTVIDFITAKKIDLVINIFVPFQENDLGDGYLIRRATIDFAIPLLTNLQSAQLFVNAISTKVISDLKSLSWDSYVTIRN